MASLQRWVGSQCLPGCDSFDMQCKLSYTIWCKTPEQSAHKAALRNLHLWCTGSDWCEHVQICGFWSLRDAGGAGAACSC